MSDQASPKNAVTTVASIATVAATIGVVDLPYGYYTLLRFFLCGASLFLLYGSPLLLRDWQRWTLGSFAVLYNPVFPIHLGEKLLWISLNFLTVALFWAVRAQAAKADNER